MKSLIKQTGLALVALSAPIVAFAQEAHDAVHEVAEGASHAVHEGHGWDTTGLIASFVNFAVLILLFVWLFKDSLKSYLKSRRAEVEQQLLEAARLKAEAEVKHKEYTTRLAQLDGELEQIKSDMITAGKKERDRIIADAEHKAARMRAEAEFTIEQYVKQLRLDLSREAAETAIGAAEELLLRATTTYDQQRLSQEYLTSLAGNGDASAKKPSLMPQSESRV